MSYPDVLAELWRQHLSPRESNAPTVISTFAGCGGSSLGYSAAGYRELLAVEMDHHATATFRENFPEVDLYHGDIAALSVQQVLDRCQIQPRELDVFDGSPPCQGFSTAGKRQISDPRNQLFREYVRLLSGLQPRAFVVENVSGMVKGAMRLIFRDVLAALKDCGYHVSAKLVNFAHLGVPQKRERMIFIGVRDDLAIDPSHPVPATRPVTVRQAFIDVPAGDSDDYRKSFDDELRRVAALLYSGDFSSDRAMAAMMAVRGSTGSARNFTLLSWDRESCTVFKAEIARSGIIHPDRARYISIPEAKRLCSFPDEFIIRGNRAERMARLGNSVPPLGMRAIAQHIRDHILVPAKQQKAA